MNLSGFLCLLLPGSLLLIAFSIARRGTATDRRVQAGSRTGVVMGHVYDPMGFRTLDVVISDEGQNRPEIVVNNQRDSNLLLIEGEDGLTVLELGPESGTDGDTAPLN
jgi:hypothetical protein